MQGHKVHPDCKIFTQITEPDKKKHLIEDEFPCAEEQTPAKTNGSHTYP